PWPTGSTARAGDAACAPAPAGCAGAKTGAPRASQEAVPAGARTARRSRRYPAPCPWLRTTSPAFVQPSGSSQHEPATQSAGRARALRCRHTPCTSRARDARRLEVAAEDDVGQLQLDRADITRTVAIGDPREVPRTRDAQLVDCETARADRNAIQRGRYAIRTHARHQHAAQLSGWLEQWRGTRRERQQRIGHDVVRTRTADAAVLHHVPQVDFDQVRQLRAVETAVIQGIAREDARGQPEVVESRILEECRNAPVFVEGDRGLLDPERRSEMAGHAPVVEGNRAVAKFEGAARRDVDRVAQGR